MGLIFANVGRVRNSESAALTALLRQMSPRKAPKRFRVILPMQSTVVHQGGLDFPSCETSQTHNVDSHRDFQHQSKSFSLALRCSGFHLQGFRLFEQLGLVFKKIQNNPCQPDVHLQSQPKNQQEQDGSNSLQK